MVIGYWLLIAYFLLFVFVLGTVTGSFINVAVSRLPLEKSLVWPGSRCTSCYQRIRWYDNLPIISYLWLRGKCRTCGTSFSVRYLLVELATGLGFAGLFYLEVVRNIHDWPDVNGQFRVGAANIITHRGFFLFPWQWWVGFFYHAVLFSFLMVTAVCDLDGREIPIQATLTGAVIGLLGATLLPWPWPWLDGAPTPNRFGTEWLDPGSGLKAGLYPWPFWGPLPSWFAPGGNWQTGLATGIAGALVGTFMLRAVGFLFSTGLGREALGLGDADLMMMAGCFLGWQPIVTAFFISVAPALVVGLFQLTIRKDDSLPFGPSLAMGIIITMLCWRWLGEFLQPLFFFGWLMLVLCVFCGAFMLLASYVLRLMRGNVNETNPNR